MRSSSLSRSWSNQSRHTSLSVSDTLEASSFDWVIGENIFNPSHPPEGIEGEDGDDSSPLSLIKKPGLVVLLCHLLLSHKTLIDTWLMLLEEGGELHRVITRLNTLYPTI